MARAAVALVALLGSIGMSMASVAGSAAPAAATEPTLQRFLARADEPLTEYRAVRRLEASNPKFDMQGSMEALTEMSGGTFTFTILHEEGSDYIRRKVLRPLLENEQKLFAAGDPSRSALTRDNYELTAGEIAEPDLVKLLAKPRRRDIALVEGAVFVTRDEADLVRVEGRLSKNPSFWTKRVDLVRQYERIAGLRVPVRLDTTAQIRFAGTSTMSVTYEYEMVNGVDLPKPVVSEAAP
jgi:hypothetical protein